MHTLTDTTTPRPTWAQARQGATLVTADSWGERWTRDDLEFVREFTATERDEDLAYALGRTLYALWAIQHRIVTEGVEGVIAAYDARDKRDATLVRPLSSRTYTFVGDDVPADW